MMIGVDAAGFCLPGLVQNYLFSLFCFLSEPRFDQARGNHCLLTPFRLQREVPAL